MRGIWRFVPFFVGAIFCLVLIQTNTLASISKRANVEESELEIENIEEPNGPDHFQETKTDKRRKVKSSETSEVKFVDPRLAPLPILLKPESDFCEGRKFLVALHMSAHDFSRREFWRETYGKLAKQFKYNILFFLGKYNGPDSSIPRQIEKEAEKFGDILQSDFIDSYKNLTYKHISLLRYFDENCGPETVLAKMDDDMMWKVKEASKEVEKFHENKNSTMSCHLFRKWPVHRHPKDKWRVTKEEYFPDHWPTFCGGMFYLASHSAVSKLLSTLHLSEFFWIDDAYLTGIVRSNSNFELTRINGIVNSQQNEWEKRLKGDYVFSLAPRKDSRTVFEMFNKL